MEQRSSRTQESEMRGTTPKSGESIRSGHLVRQSKIRFAVALPHLADVGLFLKGTTHEIFKEQNINKSGSNGCT